MEATHASFFSGVGGLDMGLERAGWRTVSFSEIDPYASAVLAQRWPGVPNLGDIQRLRPAERPIDGRRRRDAERDDALQPWTRASLWTGGFPCQDLSVAGKRRGLAGSRSGLAFSFLALVERHRPPAVLLENVPGLLSSHAGRDLGALLGTLGELGYGWAYRVLDARHFGVPQRRRRVFILGIHARVDPAGQRAAEVLSVGSRCPRHPATGHETGEGAAERAVPGVDIARVVTGTAGKRHDDDTDTLIAIQDGRAIEKAQNGRGWSDDGTAYTVDGTGAQSVLSPSPDTDRDRAADGLAGRLDGGGGVAVAFAQNQRGELRTSDTAFQLTAGGGKPGEGYSAVLGATGKSATDKLLPLGLDGHRYRCCGNGVVSSVSEWIGVRLLQAVA